MASTKSSPHDPDPARPLGDDSEWLWRTAHSFVSGNLHSDVARNERSIVHNAHGDPVKTSMLLSGTLALKRRHETPGPLHERSASGMSDPAGEPRTATLMEQTPDEFGNMIARTGANGRCRWQVVFDDAYAAQATQEAVYAGPIVGQCGTEQLLSTAIYDRGTGAVTEAHDLHDEVTLAGYDGLGRVTSLTKPDPWRSPHRPCRP